MAGYCWSQAHQGFLTVELIRKHKCLQKECRCFEKIESHPYWEDKKKNQKKHKIGSAIKSAYLKGKISYKQYDELSSMYKRLGHGITLEELRKKMITFDIM